jgi:hypothetical protein
VLSGFTERYDLARDLRGIFLLIMQDDIVERFVVWIFLKEKLRPPMGLLVMPLYAISGVIFTETLKFYTMMLPASKGVSD